MEGEFNVNYEKNLNNIHSFLDELLNNYDENKVALGLQNLELLLEHVDAGLNRLYKLRSEYRDEIFNYLLEKILNTREQIIQSNFSDIHERLRLLDLFSDMVQDTFKKKIKKNNPIIFKAKNTFFRLFRSFKIIE